MSNIAIPTPFAAHGLLFVCSGYVMDKKRPIFAVKPGAANDITPPEGKDHSEFIAWSQPQAGPYNPTPVVYGEYLYVLFDGGFLACHDAKTGKLHYNRERIPGQYTASPWAADGKIFCLNEDGDTVVVKAGAKFEQLGRNKLGEMALSTPALSGDRLLIRTLTKLWCVKKS